MRYIIMMTMELAGTTGATTKKARAIKVTAGIDLGNGYTKFKGQRFASRVKFGTLARFGEKQENVYEVTYDGNTYVVGEGSNFATGDRYYTTEYKLCLLTAIAQCEPTAEKINAEVCVGLPISKFMSPARKEVQAYLQGLEPQSIIIEGRQVDIDIKKVTVFVEGAFVSTQKDITGNVLSIDIGEGTCDIVQWKNKQPIVFDTKEKSFYTLYNSIAKYMQEKYSVTVSASYVEQNIGNDKILINQTEYDFKVAQMFIDRHIASLYNDLLNSDFKLEEVEQVYIMGGGAIPTFKYWIKHFKKAEQVDNCQFINSEIYDKVVRM